MGSPVPGPFSRETPQNEEKPPLDEVQRWFLAMKCRKTWNDMFVTLCGKAGLDETTWGDHMRMDVGPVSATISLPEARAYRDHLTGHGPIDMVLLRARYSDDFIVQSLLDIVEDLW